MSECDPTENEINEPMLVAGATEHSVPDCASSDHLKVFFDRNGFGSGGLTNPGVAVRISDSRESILTELETDGSGEETLLLPCLAGTSSSPRGVREKRSKRNRHSSSSDKDTLASPGNCPDFAVLLKKYDHTKAVLGYVFFRKWPEVDRSHMNLFIRITGQLEGLVSDPEVMV